MQYDLVLQYMLSRLEEELPFYLTYHSVEHTQSVLEVAGQLCDQENITGDEKTWVLTAALFHDAGYLEGYTGHEEKACAMAHELLPNYLYSPDDIRNVCGLIAATSVQHKPETFLEKVVSDATYSYLGTTHYFAKADRLYHEMQHFNLVRDREDWHKKEIALFEQHEFYTPAAIKQFVSLKRQNLQLLTTKGKPANGHQSKLRATINDWILIVLGSLMAGFGLKGFLEPNEVYDGGITGISLILNRLFSVDLSLLIVVLNLPILIASYFGTFKSLAVKTTAAIVILGLCLHFVHYPVVTEDKLLVAVFGGFFLGLGSGLAIRGGAALDGTEILAMYTIKRTSFTISEIILFINVIIFSVAALKFDANVALYSILTYMAASQTIGYVIEGIEAYMGVTIISENSELIKRRLVNEMGRGITVYKGERGFLPGDFDVSHNCDIIFTVITRLELRRLKNVVYKSDSKAFVFANTIKEASGGVIKRKDTH